jgi:hypothetical protein
MGTGYCSILQRKTRPSMEKPVYCCLLSTLRFTEISVAKAKA